MTKTKQYIRNLQGVNTRLDSALARIVRHKSFRRWYPLAAALVLVCTTVYWAVLGARLQASNADQLSDVYLFSDWNTFHNATFPSAHSFLLKWPIFLIVGITGASDFSLVAATLLLSVLTVVALIYLIFRLERRPIIRGTILLAISIILLLIPAQPYSGGILPVNMAMLTTRNVEYVVFIAALLCFIKAKQIKDRNTLYGFGLLVLLFASDKLFVSLSLGGALTMLVTYALLRNWQMVTVAVRWLVSSVAATAGAFMLLAIISLSGITNFAGSAAGGYGAVTSIKELALGGTYALMGTLTNLGANPAYQNRVIGRLPHDILSTLISPSGFIYIITLIIACYALRAIWKTVRPTIRIPARRPVKISAGQQLSLMLVSSTATATIIFVATRHYYAVDARYLTIVLFAAGIAVATYTRRIRWERPGKILLTGFALAISLPFAAAATYAAHIDQHTALIEVNERNRLVNQALSHHKVDTLVGDYWRVLPIKQDAMIKRNVLPLADCTNTLTALSSTAWRPDLSKHSFAYLITLDGNLTNFPNCSLEQVTQAYGRPNATQIIAGTTKQPKEALLFYDHGRHVEPTRSPAASMPAPLLPVGLQDLPGVTCSEPTVLSIVAHQDDDLLFQSPDLLRDIDAGHCMRTVYLTAGDSGLDKFYWLNRQLGAEAAYSNMTRNQTVWEQRTVVLPGGSYVTVASPRGNTKVSLVFFNLPDGGIHGTGFAANDNQSLSKLRSGVLPQISSVDKESMYSSRQLTQSLAALMNTYQPTEIRTQADVASDSYPDHSDHIATGDYAVDAAQVYSQEHFGGAVQIPVIRYIGYPIHGYGTNVDGEDFVRKEAAFLAYAQYDGGVCHSVARCAATATYGSYLPRQYRQEK